MISIDDVLEIHDNLIELFGGSKGVRERGLVEAAINRPFGGFGEDEFYPTPEEKAAAVLESIVQNHPFIDGNKRTGYYLARAILLNYGIDLSANQSEKYSFVIQVASGKMRFEEIVSWIQENSTPLS